MAAHAGRLEMTVEERMARLESHVEHIQADLTEVKGVIRHLDQKMEKKFDSVDKKFESVNQKFDSLNRKFDSMNQKLDSMVEKFDQKIDQKFESVNQKIDSMNHKFESKFDSLKDSQHEFRLTMEKSLRRLMLWGLTLHVALATGLLGVMAKGFGWIK